MTEPAKQDDLKQGNITWAFDGRGKPILEWHPFCPECHDVGNPYEPPHDHRVADLELILAELRRVRVEQTPMRALELEPAGEHLTLRELARYAKRSTKWLLARTKDSVDPLPCERPSAGKVTFSRPVYDRWIGRQRPDTVEMIATRMMTRLERGSR